MFKLNKKTPMHSINNTQLHAFDELFIVAQAGIQEKLQNDTVVHKAIKLKNLFQSLRPDKNTIIEQHVQRVFQLQDVKTLEYGSRFCHLVEMRNAIEALLAEENTLSSEEASLLHLWIKAVIPAAEQISCIFDYFRAEVPSVIDSLLQGRDPIAALSLPMRLMLPFYLPSTKQLEAISHFITAQIAEMQPGEFLAIPWGNFSHETLMVVEKTNENDSRLFLIDPNTRLPYEICLSDVGQRSDPIFWQTVIKSKFQYSTDFSWKALSCHSNDLQGIPSELFLQSQRGNQCFAYAHLQLLRFLALKVATNQTTKAAELCKVLEIKIRKKIWEFSPHQSGNLGKCAEAEIERKGIKCALLTEPKRVAALCVLGSKLLSKIPSKNEKQKLAQSLIDSHFQESKQLSWKEKKKIIQVLQSLVLDEEARLPFSELSEEEIDLIIFIEHQRDLYKEAKKSKYSALISILETAENFRPNSFVTFLRDKTSILTFFDKTSLLKDPTPYTSGISWVDLVGLEQNVEAILEQQTSLEDLGAMARRLIACVSKESSVLEQWMIQRIGLFLHFHPIESDQDSKSANVDLLLELSKVKFS